jgi:hypothetical protein
MDATATPQAAFGRQKLLPLEELSHSLVRKAEPAGSGARENPYKPNKT